MEDNIINLTEKEKTFMINDGFVGTQKEVDLYVEPKDEDKAGLFYFGFFLIAVIIGVPLLIKGGKSIWWYLLLFILIAPIAGSLGSMLYTSVKKK